MAKKYNFDFSAKNTVVKKEEMKKLTDAEKRALALKSNLSANKPPQATTKPPVASKPIVPSVNRLVQKEAMLEPTIAKPGIKPLLSATSDKAGRPVGTNIPAPLAKTTAGAGFQFGVASAFGGKQLGDGAISQNIKAKQAENEDIFNKAKIGGQLVGTAGQYMLANQAVNSAAKVVPLLGNLSNAGKVAATIGTDQLVDNIVRTPQTIIQGKIDNKSGMEIAKDVGKQNVEDLAWNVGMAAGGVVLGKVADIVKAHKAAGKTVAEIVDDVDVKKAITESTGVQEGTEDFVKAQQDLAKEIEGRFTYTNPEYKKTFNELEEGITDVQNHFGTNQLRADEQAAIKPELGIDFEDIFKRLDETDIPVSEAVKREANIPNATKNSVQQAKVAGVDVKLPKLNRNRPVVEPPIPKVIKSATYGTASAPKVESELNITPPKKAAQNATDSVKTASLEVDDMSFELKGELPKKSKFEDADAINNRNNGDGSIEGFRRKINYDPKKNKKPLKEVFEGLRRDFVDDLAPLEKAEKAVFGKVQSAEKSLYKTARNEKRSINLAEQIIHTDLEPILKSVEKQGFQYTDLGEYALAVHAKDVNAKGIVSGFDNADIDAVIGKLGTPEMEAARKQLVKISNNLLDMMQDSGLISKEQVKAMLEKHPNYMPLFRSFDDEKVDFVSAFGSSFSKSDAPIYALKGSEKQVNSPMENMLKNIYRSVDAAKKNDVGVQLIKLAEADTNSTFARVIADTESTTRKNVVNAVVDGKAVKLEVDPELFKAFTGMNKEMTNKFIEILSKPASVLRAGATLTPEFAARNPLRDMVEAFTKSESGFNPVVDFPRGMASVIKKDEYYDLWMRSGGGGTGIISHDIQAHRKGLLEGLKKSPKEKFITVVNPNTYLDILRKMSEVTEEATRVGEFRKALKSGATPQEAAYRSADLMDFTRSGASVRQVNRVVAFFNANIQGKSKLIRAIKANPKQATVKAVTSMAIPTVAIYGYNQASASDKQKRIIKDAPDWQKNTFWLIASPFDDEYVIRMPKPFELSIIANATERFMDFVVEKDPKAFDDFFGQAVKDQAMPIMPTGLIPIFEGAANYSMFRQSSIIPERERYVKKENQYDYTTSEVSKGIAKGISAIDGGKSNYSSPRIVDHVLKTSTGGLGTYALDATDALLDALGIVDRPTKAKKDVTQMPMLKGFTVNSLSSGKSIGKMYDLDNAFETEKKTMRDELGDSYKTNSEYQKLLEDSKKIASVTEQLSDISKQIREINNSTSMSPEKKQRELKVLADKRNKLAFEELNKISKAKWFKERGID